LCAARRKQKWSVDPRNSAWSNDDSKFGQRMLERMGWSKGKGLGRSEQGATDHIKVKVKNDNYGLGTTASYEDNWIAHQDDFNELLAQLNNHHGQNNSNTEPPPEEQKGFSLEEKSKTSRKRVHYMKFTKGKDLSSRTETDLNCIFGKRTKSAKDQEQKSFSCTPVNLFLHPSAGLIDSPPEYVGLGILAHWHMSCRWLSIGYISREEIELECLEGGGLLNVFPPSPFLWDPLWALPVFPAQPQPQPPPGERAEQEGPDSQPDRSSAEGALSQNCTQCTERILFLGFWVLEEEKEEEGQE
ncbi:PIN2/TERF1-interacting telomerase inhibitor 1, partial [Nibea albiflora]